MRQIEVTDDWLYQYMPIVDEAIIRELEDGTDYGYTFSTKFERRMKGLIWKEEHPWAGAVYRQLKRTAALGVCAAAVLFLFTMSVEGNRVKFFETVRTLWEDSVEYVYISDEETNTFYIQEPGYMPEGYVEIERYETDNLFNAFYQNELGELITWEQWKASSGDSVVLDTEYDLSETIVAGGKYVNIYSYSEGLSFAYCEYKEYVYILTADNLSIEEIYKMFLF